MDKFIFGIEDRVDTWEPVRKIERESAKVHTNAIPDRKPEDIFEEILANIKGHRNKKEI